MQPIFFSFASGLHYRKTVKLYFRRIATFDLVVSICENTLFQRFLSFLTAGNKSYCGTLQRLTGSQQSTDKPIFRPVSPPKRQAMQGKSFVLSPISTQTSSHLRTHRTFDPPRGRRGSYRAIRMWLRRPWAAAGPGHAQARPIGGRRVACGAWPGFEPTRRAKLAARTASGRAGHAAAGNQAGRATPEIWRAEQRRRSGGPQPQQAFPQAAAAQ